MLATAQQRVPTNRSQTNLIRLPFDHFVFLSLTRLNAVQVTLSTFILVGLLARESRQNSIQNKTVLCDNISQRVEVCAKPIMDLLYGTLEVWPSSEKDVEDNCATVSGHLCGLSSGELSDESRLWRERKQANSTDRSSNSSHPANLVWRNRALHQGFRQKVCQRPPENNHIE